ncbi:head-tail connector protein [Orrella sp. 11846]|uniref:head-tail connector protein n=1 Tax=Orrella sp. 11846 TaxID=3409913 RepID=UPI003B5972F1
MIDLTVAKDYLDVIHSADDEKLLMLLRGAEDEAAQFMNREHIDDVMEGSELPGSVVLGAMLLLQAAYQASPEDAVTLRQAAQVKLAPYRICMGV